MDQQSLVGSFLSQVDRRPHATALTWQQDEITYRELYELAAGERSRVRATDAAAPIGLPAPKSPAAIALILAALLEGRSFLLPPPTLGPTAREQLFAQAGCHQVLSPERSPERSPEAAPSAPWQRGPSTDVSFMLATSGSTGRPKVVPISVGAVDRFTDWAGERFGIGPGSTVLNYAPLNFDLCLLDVWTTLKRGGRVVLVDPERATQGRYLLDLVTRHGVGVIQAVPMFYRLLADAAARTGRALGSVEHAVFTGDRMPARTLAELPRLFGRARLYNLYGCTETNDSFLHELDPAESPDAPVPLGRPLPGVNALLVAEDGTVLTGPGTGELYVATPFQTDGYLGDADRQDVFARHPEGLDELRYFRSGDLVRRAADGRLTLEGRRDFQVKVRGVRINTQEIEHVLAEHPDVVEAAVVARPDPVAGKLLHAVVRRRPGSALDSLSLRRHCTGRLALAAVPTTVRLVDLPLPKTSTGKVDRDRVARTYPTPDRTRES